jgi:transcriptional regulator with XRE-family HTH domain
MNTKAESLKANNHSEALQGARIKEARMELGLSQESLGKKVGVTKSAVSQWENELTTPTSQNILAIADLTGFSFRWLINGTGVKKEVTQ